MKKIFKEAISILDGFTELNDTLMTNNDLVFLCGMIEKYVPKKILELGVYAGGTTAVIMKMCTLLGIEPEIISVDLCEDLIDTKAHKSGFLGKRAQEMLNYQKWKLYTGEYYIDNADKIGDNIDFVILDTVHYFPGEMFDYIAVLPHIKIGGLIVLHDVLLNHWPVTLDPETTLAQINGAYATKIVFDTAVGKKYWNKDNDKIYDFSNIAAFEVTKDTKKCVYNSFSSFTLPWSNDPSEEMMCKYKKYYKKYYSEDLIDLYDRAVKLHLKSKWLKKAASELIKNICDYVRDTEENIYIYGAGNNGQCIYNFLKRHKLSDKIIGFVVSDGQPLSQNTKKEIYHISSIPTDSRLIIAVSHQYFEDIIITVNRIGFKDYFVVDELIYN